MNARVTAVSGSPKYGEVLGFLFSIPQQSTVRKPMAEQQKETQQHSPRQVGESQPMGPVAGNGNAPDDSLGTSLATAVVVGAGVSLVAAELLPGMLIGVGAMLLPKLLPGVADMFRPLVKTTIRAGYTTAVKAREMLAEASEQVQDMVAEAKAETEAGQQTTHARTT
jgi:hypothetical protein